MGHSALPDMYAFCPQACGPRAVGHTYQAKLSCPCYNYYINLDPFRGEFGGFWRCLSYLDPFHVYLDPSHVYYMHLHW